MAETTVWTAECHDGNGHLLEDVFATEHLALRWLEGRHSEGQQEATEAAERIRAEAIARMAHGDDLRRSNSAAAKVRASVRRPSAHVVVTRSATYEIVERHVRTEESPE